MATRQQILDIDDIVTEKVPVPEWKGTFNIRGMNGTERDDYEAAIMTGRGKNRDLNLHNARAKLVVRCLVDDNGERIFSDEDAPRVGAKNAAALDRLFTVASRLSGISAEDLETLTKNSSGQSGDSTIA